MEDRYDFRAIEKKWQQRWEAEQTFRAPDSSDRPKFYVLEMFPYPSGSGLSVGHVKNYSPADAFCRFKSMQGFNVLHPMGWDAFGQPAENEALNKKRNPREMVPEYAANYRRQLKLIGASYDWSREINSSTPDYYKWTQWLFLLLYKRGLAYRADAPINWCPSCKTGLANEEVQDGRCWRCGHLVEKRPMPQWYFKITEYADRLLADLEKINWSEGLKEMQRDWIGRSEGAEISFEVLTDQASKIENRKSKIDVFTTRPDTLWGATFLVLAPEHPLVAQVTTEDRRQEVDEYVRRAQMTAEIDRMNAERTKTGVFTGASARNPVSGLPVPIWVADYVLLGYGTGAIMAVPAHDQRDFEFARKFDLPIELVYQAEDGPASSAEMTEALPHQGVMRSFIPAPEAATQEFPFAGRPNSKATVSEVIAWMERHGIGKGTITYRLRDWLISRQRYWGAPIPIVHCPSCGEVPVPDDQLPVMLPEVEQYQPTGTGESPLAAIPEFVNTTCPKCTEPAKRETDTMGGYACSSWYFMRFADPCNENEFASREKLDYWLPVDVYSGGIEHARSHLLYSRFWVKVLFDAGLVSFEEPFMTLHNQGSMLAWTPGRRPRGNEQSEDEDGESVIDWIVLKPEELPKTPKEEIVYRWARMSKSKGNVVTPDEMAEKFGADSLRLYEMFVAPFYDDVQWSEDGMVGASRYVNRVWRWLVAAMPHYSRDWRTKLQEDGLSEADRVVRRRVHQAIGKVGSDLQNFRFNTAVAALMTLTNELYAWRPIEGSPPQLDSARRAVLSEALESLILMLAPFTPHLADELWERAGHKGSTYRAPWPEFDSEAAKENEIEVVVQVNGKLRDKLTVPAEIGSDELKSLALASEKVKEILDGKTVRNVIVVPKKLVNVVVG